MEKNFYNLRDIYKFYRENSNKPVNKQTYLKLTALFSKFLIKKLYEKGKLILPARLGLVSIIGRKTTTRFVDGKIRGPIPNWKETRKLWEEDPEAKKNKQLIFLLNEETDGIKYKYVWSRKNVLVFNKDLYNIVFTRKNKRDLAKLIKSGKEYIIQ